MRNDDPAAQRVAEDLQHLIGTLMEAASQTSTHAARFSESLARLAGALERGEGPRAGGGSAHDAAPALTLATVVADVIADTGTMRQHIGGLAQRLVMGRREIERLRSEMQPPGPPSVVAVARDTPRP
jgi:hypothetical protein